jgi:phospholipase C
LGGNCVRLGGLRQIGWQVRQIGARREEFRTLDRPFHGKSLPNVKSSCISNIRVITVIRVVELVKLQTTIIALITLISPWRRTVSGDLLSMFDFEVLGSLALLELLELPALLELLELPALLELLELTALLELLGLPALPRVHV